MATAARTRGCQVTCVELDALPLSRLMGDDVGKRIVSWWDGIDLRLGAAVRQVVPGGVELADGSGCRRTSC